MTDLTGVNPGVQMIWSPDSKYLLYFNDGEIWAVNSGTKDKKQLASGVSFVTSLLWPGEKEIIFSGALNKNTDDYVHIYRIKLK